MIKSKTVANAGWIIGCRIVQSVLAIIVSMLTARYLGPSNFGLINFAASIVTFVSPIATLGLSNVLVQEIIYSPESEGKILGTSITMSLVSSVFCIIGVVSFSLITNPNEKDTVIVCALYSLMLIAQALEIIQYWFQAKLISKYTAVVSVIAYIVISLYKIFLLITGKSVYWFAVSNAIDYFIIGCVLLVIYKIKNNNSKLQFSLDWAKRLFGKSKYFIISSMMVTIFAQLDKIMLKYMIDDKATGIYSAACACAGMTSFLFLAIIDSMRPTIMGCKKSNSPFYEVNVCRLYSIVIYLALAQSLFITIFAKPIILVLYGAEYIESVVVLMFFVWQTTFSYMGSVRNMWMLAENKQQYLWIINLSGVVMNIILNVFLIQILGAVGAAIATVITQFFTNFVLGIILKPIRYNNLLIIKSLNPKLLIDIIKSFICRNHS